jgi:hypothetical protein
VVSRDNIFLLLFLLLLWVVSGVLHVVASVPLENVDSGPIRWAWTVRSLGLDGVVERKIP